MKKRMVVTDLDGTLLDGSGKLGATNEATLTALGEAGVVRVVATGRSLYSADNVLTGDFPIDYLVFSSGAGIMAWDSRDLVNARHMPGAEALAVGRFLKDQGLDFMLHHPAPESHRFVYFQTSRDNPDFRRRCERYQEYASPWDGESTDWDVSSQLLVVAPASFGACVETIAQAFPELNVVRTTSPLDGASLWIEIFPGHVSKAQASQWIGTRHQIAPADTVAVGNDYNDLDLLDWAGASFVVANAAAPLRSQYTTVAANDKGGFSDAVHAGLGQLP